MNLDELIEKEIGKLQEERKGKERSGCWNPSSFGRCFRNQYWNRQDRPVTNPPNMKALKTFRVGDIFHRDIQALLPDNSVEVEFTVGDIHGFADHVGSDYVVDFKTTGAWQWKKINGKAYNIEKDNLSYVLQIMSYCYFLDKPTGYLVFICKDTYETKTFELSLDKWRKAVTEELVVLRGYWETESLPQAIPRAYGLRECAYCPFSDDCDSMECNTANDRKAIAEGEKVEQKTF